jgi:hypothetical protein
MAMSQPQKKGWRQKVSETIYRPQRIEQGWNRLHREAGFIPIYNLNDTESRRAEIKTVLEESKDALFDREKQREIAKKTYAIFFSAGNPWYRGLDNRELADKVRCFLENYTEVGDMEEFIPDLFEESMQLLSLSWQALDVTNTPPYIIEAPPKQGYGGVDLGDESGDSSQGKHEEV